MALTKIVAVSVVAASAMDLTWNDCGDADTHAVITDLAPLTLNTGANHLVAKATLDKDEAGGTFEFNAKVAGISVLKGNGNLCEDTHIDLPLGAGSFVVHGINCPAAAGDLEVDLDVNLLSLEASNALTDISLTATSTSGDKLMCLNLGVSGAAKKKHARGFVRMPRNSVVEAAVITDEMRAAAPTKLDWSKQGATTAVKDQGYCGSCWAFSATEGIESAVFMATGQLPPPLSTQQIVACDKDDYGCDGGDLPTAFDYVISDGGIDSESGYPDTSSSGGRTGKCKSHSQVVKVTGYKYAVPPCEGGSCGSQDEDGLKAALNSFGPLSVCVNADWDTWSESGVYTKKCSGKYNALDHCVQLVGYDTTASTPYWLVKNSWANDWGENGFIRLPMGQNACGIADEAMYVTATMAATDVTV